MVRSPSPQLSLTAVSMSALLLSNDQVIWTVIGKDLDRDSLALVWRVRQAFPSRVRFFSQESFGIYEAMNQALSLVVGDYFVFLNSGDLIRPDIRGAIGQLSPNSVVCYRTAWHDLKGREILPPQNHPGSFAMMFGRYPNHQGMVFSRRFCRFRYDESLSISADLELKLRLAQAGMLHWSQDSLTSGLVGGVSGKALSAKEAIWRWRDQVTIFRSRLSPVHALMISTVWALYFVKRVLASTTIAVFRRLVGALTF